MSAEQALRQAELRNAREARELVKDVGYDFIIDELLAAILSVMMKPSCHQGVENSLLLFVSRK